MALLLEKAAVLQQTGGSAVEELFEITNLIKVICQQDAFKSEFVKASSGELKQQFRNMWFYFVLYVMKSDGSWPKDWIPVLNAIAENTPTLVPDVSQRSLVADLGANSILRGSFPDSITQKIKNCILSRWPHAVQVNDPKVMPWSVQVFLFTIYKIESLRIRSNHKVDNLKEYLTDQRLQPPDIYMILELSVHEIFKQAVSDPRYKTHHISIHENHISALVYFGSQRIPKVRQFARKWVRHVLKSVPKLIWHQRSVFAAFDTIQLLERLADEKGVSNRHQPPYVFVSAQEAKEAYQDFLKIVEGWLDIGFSQSSNETLGVIQTYLVSDAATHSVNYGEVPGLMEILNHFTKGSTMTSSVIKSLSKYSKYLGEIQGMILMKEHEGIESTAARQMISKRVRDDLKKIYRQPEDPILSQELSDALLRCAAMIILSTKVESELLYLICAAPKQIYSANAMHAATNAWAWVMFNRPEYHSRMLVYMVQIWDDVAVAEQGIYSKTHQNMHPFATRMNYGTPNQVTQESFTCEPHSIWIEFLYERFKSDKMHDIDHVYLYMHLFLIAGRDGRSISTSWAALEARFDLALFGLRICSELIVWSQTSAVFVFREVLHLAFGWFAQAPMFGALTTREFEKIALFYKVLSDLKIDKVSLTPEQKLLFPGSPDGERVNVSEAQQVLLLLLESELHRFATWISPLQSIELEMPSIPQPVNERLVKWNQVVRVAWQIEPLLAVHLRSRFSNSMAIIDMELAEYTRDFEVLCSASPEALDLLMKSNWKKNDDQLRLLLYWTPVTPILAINLLGSQQTFQTWVLQYAIRSLKFFPTDQVFFYIPQIVQALRRDNAGYIEQFILDAAMTSQQFAHQIVWNMKANMFKDEATEEPDALKPVLDRIINKIINSLTGSDKKFYEREFKFFEAVTGISGKLKPLVQANATKAEKKKKIDQEMRLIQVDPGVYLPTNPDQYVVDIDYDSGRPLQSHAKAPFMATFEVKDIRSEHPVTKRMASMFKVGDDCRQDVLALQLISCFQNVFNSVGLDLYTFPYRVVATAPGCGVIEVIPNSISRDMMGREKVNSLYDWFIAQFGSPDSMEYHNARYEFVKSLAAYSVVLFLLQIKDRHNGNIMFDRDGHMIHIDFGFMLSIAPGGGILEVSPFKLTTEMVQVMGGDAGTHWYKLFSELLIKAYLATRKYAEELILMVQLMLDSGLPCFKGEVTIKKLRERFQLDKTDRQAAEFMIGCIRQSHENTRSGLYDRFQYLQNGIPF
ncbi:hypothetical protein EDD86DRAFT_186242 [Gorgonomyces haynaldii]|nr:hypothetical protein EDD86DRAFT_186242 [Gorgonomyces haynaldii]